MATDDWGLWLGYRYDIDLNEREFANGMSGQRLSPPRTWGGE